VTPNWDFTRRSHLRRQCRWPAGMGTVTLTGLAGWMCALLAASLLAPFLNAQVHDERAIKVAYVFNLTKYVAWPHAGSELVLGFVGDSSMGEALEKMLTGKTSESRVIRVVLSPKDEALEQCDVLYVAYSSPKKVRAALDRVRGKSVLTVGDTDSFSREGGMVGLVRTGQQVQIQVNLEAVQEARLKISSRMLDLATIVHSTPGAKD
jgi:YfiR/HmsC-like